MKGCAWRHLCSSPRVWVSASAAVDAAACQRLVAACRRAIEAQPPNSSYEGIVDYRSLPLAACGADAQAAFIASGAIELATATTGSPGRHWHSTMSFVLIDCHCRSFLRDLLSNLAVIAFIFCQNESVILR